MSIINAMPGLLADVEPHDPVPLYIQYGYAMYTLRSILGRGRYDAAEDRIVTDIYRQEAAQAGQRAVERRAELEHDAPRIKAHFQAQVNSVLEHLLPDGSCRIKTRRGGVAWTCSPSKIASELNVLPAAVRQAQVQLRKQKAG